MLCPFGIFGYGYLCSRILRVCDWLQHLAKRMPDNIAAAQMGINDDDDVYTPQQLTCMKLGGTLITFTGFCWRCHSTEHKNAYKCPNAKDDKYDGNFEKNHMRYFELKEIEMKKEKKCSRCTAKKKLSGFFLCDWYKDESERVCKDCRKLEVKMCNMCNTWKKRHSFKKEEWDLNDGSLVYVSIVSR